MPNSRVDVARQEEVLDNFHRRARAHVGAGRFIPLTVDASTSNDDSVHTKRSQFGVGSIASSAVTTIGTGARNARAHWRVLLFGQLVSFYLAAAGAAAEELNGTCYVSVPLTQTAVVGLVLMCLGAARLGGWCPARRRGEAGDDDGGRRDAARAPLHDGDTASLRAADAARPTSPATRAERSSRPRPFCGGLRTIHGPWPAYCLAGLVALEARYLVFLAFRYTSFTFVFLANALAIPSAMVFSKLLLGRHYQATHVLGMVVCVGGIVVSTVSDLEDPARGGSGGTRKSVDPAAHLKGDIVAIVGSILLGLDDAISENLLKNYGGENELLFMKWLFGLGIAVIQIVCLERDGLATFFQNQGDEPCALSARCVLFATFVVFQVLDMAGEVRFLGLSEAALLNLSLLTSDLWAVVFSVVATGTAPSAAYYGAFLLIVAGIVLYEAGPSPTSVPTDIDISATVDVTGGSGDLADSAHRSAETDVAFSLELMRST